MAAAGALPPSRINNGIVKQQQYPLNHNKGKKPQYQRLRKSPWSIIMQQPVILASMAMLILLTIYETMHCVVYEDPGASLMHRMPATDTATLSSRKGSPPVEQPTPTIATSRTRTHNNMCILQTPAKHAKALSRIVLFQRDGRDQLRDFVTHYSRVLPYDSLVILDHQSNDEYTASLLKQYGALGAHIWRCTGNFKKKADMWTYVTRIYAKDSGMVFPVDVDELLTVKANETHLEWNLPAFEKAIGSLSRDGRPFKMQWMESVPAECHVHMDSVQTATHGSTYTSDMCDIQFVKHKEVGCMDKTFARGRDFYKTDTGNHYGGTKKFQTLKQQDCLEQGLENIYQVTNLTLIHLKEKTFEDWLVHGLRGATDRGFNTDTDIDCDSVEQSKHYCHKWMKIAKAKFSPYELRKVFFEDVCPDKEAELIRVGQSFCEL